MTIVIGLAKEIKSGESRVALSPIGVDDLIHKGFSVNVEQGAGEKIGYSDDSYQNVGAKILTREKLFSDSEMIVKVKEPQASEIELLKQGQIVFSYLHLASDKPQTEGLLKQKVTGIAFETVTSNGDGLPLLTPMSEIAGTLAIQQGAYSLGKPFGGSGILLGGVAGSRKGKVFVLGGGVVGMRSIAIALGMGAEVTVADISLKRLRYIEEIFGNRVNLLISNRQNIIASLREADLVVGGVLIPGAAAPKLVTKDMLKEMKAGSVIVDVAIDQGGCFETSHATTHADPVFTVDRIQHYCVANMPGAVSKTASMALEAAILPYVAKIAKNPIDAIKNDIHIKNGVNVYNGKLVNKPVSEALGIEYFDFVV
jgi:alanine dehydrogenase